MVRPLERTKQHYQKAGWTVGIVERFNPHVPPRGIRQDLYGFIDAVAIRADQPGVTALQACSTDFAEHLVKIMESDHARTWTQAGNRIVLVSWTRSERGSGGWAVREQEITAGEIEQHRRKRGTIKEDKNRAA